MARTKKSYGLSEEGNLMSTQMAVIKDYCIKTGKRITQAMVTEKWGFTRLSGIIFKLKEQLEREGNKFVICDEYVSGVNRYGNTCHFKEYWIEEAKAS